MLKCLKLNRFGLTGDRFGREIGGHVLSKAVVQQVGVRGGQQQPPLAAANVGGPAVRPKHICMQGRPCALAPSMKSSGFPAPC